MGLSAYAGVIPLTREPPNPRPPVSNGAFQSCYRFRIVVPEDGAGSSERALATVDDGGPGAADGRRRLDPPIGGSVCGGETHTDARGRGGGGHPRDGLPTSADRLPVRQRWPVYARKSRHRPRGPLYGRGGRIGRPRR